MVKAIIVDDSRLEIDNLQGSVEWETIGVTLCGTASNGKKGLELYEKEKPDMIITDIQMPVMDGIEMTSEIRKRDPDTVILFLSSYQEFEYARAGYGLGVKQYLLKQDIDSEVTRKTLQKIAEDLSKGRDSREHTQQQEVMTKQYSSAVTAAIRYMRRHLNDAQMDMEQVALAAALSTSRLRSVFKKETGVSPNQYLSELRFEEAKRLIRTTRMHTEELAETLGFADGKYFRKVFHRRFGMTPREFREQKKNEKKAV